MNSGDNNKSYDSGSFPEKEFELLVYAYLGRTLTAETAAGLKQYLQDPHYVARFVEICKQDRLIYELFSLGLPQHAQAPDSMDSITWRELAKYEECAPVFTPQNPIPQAELIQEVQCPKVEYKLNRTSLFTIFAAVAAVLFLVLLVHLTPPATGYKVAVLSDTINAKWADTNGRMEKGMPILTGRKNLVLMGGYAKIVFDNQTQVTLEGPISLQILTEDKIHLQHGKLYAKVPTNAIGFMVTTQTAKVIDLGTEFGVEVNALGDTCLHVMKGKTALIAGDGSQKNSMEVGQGTAKKITAATSMVSDIPCNEQFFARAIDSRNLMIWRGQSILSLADFAGGGNGLGTGKYEAGIDPITGEPSEMLLQNRKSENDFHPVPSNSYVDGVFIPNGRTEQIISSEGHLFRKCPLTSGTCYNNILNSMRRIPVSQAAQNEAVSEFSFIHCLLMHANTGITYDLQAIRSLLPEVNIVHFQSRIGIETGAVRPGLSNADFWVLVDGRLTYEKTQVKAKEFFSVDIELSQKNRFLTLVATDGQDPPGRTFGNWVLEPIDSDWCMFADPVLILE